MTIQALLDQVKNTPQQVEFPQVMSVIEQYYQYTPTRFKNGDLCNEAGTNEGSCKIFYFAQLHNLTDTETLSLFGTYYRDDVVKHPEGIDHSNIRTFIQLGWPAITFDGNALIPQA